MRFHPIVLALLVPVLGGMTSSRLVEAQVTGLTSLQALRHVARPLLIFAPRPDSPQLEIQMRTLEEHGGQVSDRDIVPVALPYQNPSTTQAYFSTTEADAVRRQYNVDPGDFALILIGKDGSLKLRSRKPLSMQRLNATIDAMPMRQDEIRAKHQ